MVTYEVERPDDGEDGLRVACPEHGREERFPPGRGRVAFHCPDCGYEVEVALHDDLEWRDLGERC